MRKATVKKFFIRQVNGLSDIVNARQEISRGKGWYGVNWKFREVSRDEFVDIVKNDTHITAVETKSGKFLEVDLNDFGKFTNF